MLAPSLLGDRYDRLERTTFPDASYEELSYDPRGLVTQRRNRAGRLINHAYDGAGRLTDTTYDGTYVPSQAPVAYQYDGQGCETRIERSGTPPDVSLITIAYDELGRRASETQDGRTVSWLYDIAGRPTRQTWPDGFYVTYEHTPAGQLTTIRENGTTLLATYDYDSYGRLVELIRGNGRETAFSYDPVSRVSRLNHRTLVYTDFTYNPASQLRTRLLSNTAWAWDGDANYSRNYTRNNLNQYTAVGGVAYAYDLNGNLTDNGPDTFDYDPENRLKRATVGSNTVNLRYDGRGRLRRRWDASGTVDYLYAGDALIAEYSGSTVLRRYVHGAGVDEPLVWYEGSGTTDRRYLLADERGSIATVTSNTGAILARNTYDDWGVPAATNLGRFQYTGQQWLPEIGLYYYKARFLNPYVGRFMQTDPIGYEDGMNLYAYVGNDPMNARDPDGRQTVRDMQLQMQIDDMRLQGMSEEEILSEVGRQAGIELMALSLVIAPAEIAVVRGVGWLARAFGFGRAATPSATRATSLIAQNNREIGSLRNSVRSLERNASRHEARAAEFARNPTVRPGMEGQSPARIAAQQRQRVNDLRGEAAEFRRQAQRARNDIERLERENRRAQYNFCPGTRAETCN